MKIQCTSYAFLATVGPPCTPIELYKRAKSRLFAALYGSGDDTLEATNILHKLQKKAYGIWSPFQMEDFLDYPVMPDAEQKAKEFKEEATFLKTVLQP